MEAADEPQGLPRIVVLGASAGGVEALVDVVRRLPPDLGCPVLVILHLAPTGVSVLPEILARATTLTVAPATDGAELRPDHVYVAVPDQHLLLEDSHIRLARTPRENGHRPAVDVTMRTAARAFREGAVGVVLSGTRDDGTAGLLAIKQAGGLAAAQDPQDAMHEGMPASAARHVELDALLRAAELGAWVGRSCAALPDHRGDAMPDPLEAHLRPDHRPDEDVDLRALVASTDGEPTRFTCPECGGVLFEDDQGSLQRLKCSVGHAYSIESYDAEQAQALEGALWAAVRTVEDRIVLLARLADRARETGNGRSAMRFDEQARDLAVRAQTIRGAIDRLALPVSESA